MQRPDASEYNAYYTTYTSKVPEGDLGQILRDGIEQTTGLLRNRPAETGHHRYAPGKWSVNEVLGHMIDTERVFAYRALSIARGDTAALPGMEQDEWAARSNADRRSLSSMLDEFEAVRASTVALLESLPAEAETLSGTASGFPFTVRALAHIIAGHEIHHRQVLASRYLTSDEHAS